jgi:hypothetical protein
MRIRLERLGHLIPGSPPGRERLLNEEQEQQLCLLASTQAHGATLTQGHGAREEVERPGVTMPRNGIFVHGSEFAV